MGDLIAALCSALGGLALAGGLVSTTRRIDRLEKRLEVLGKLVRDHWDETADRLEAAAAALQAMAAEDAAGHE